MTNRREFIGAMALGFAGLASHRPLVASTQKVDYICPPCGCAADGLVFDAPGKCPACGMTLIARPAPLPFEPTSLSPGRGAFLATGGPGREGTRITVHYHKPQGFGPQSRVLIVIPGAGRNADDYCDAWSTAAERRNLLVAALGYPEGDYDFAAYQMGGVIKNLRIANIRPDKDGRPPSTVYLRDEDIGFDPNPDPAQWLFADFDRIFSLLVAATRSRRTGYDLFGHSAGGQILHRLALFRPHSAAERIVAANAGLYTQPDLDLPQPIGLKGSGATPAMLGAGLRARLYVLLGEADNDGEAGGIQLHTPTIDRYGVDRLARGMTFFRAGQLRAAAMGVPLGWRLRTIPKIGHDYRGMTRAAEALLYDEPENRV